MSRVILICLVFVAGACDRPDIETCNKACLNYARLMHWEKFEKEAESLDLAAKDSLRVDYQKKWAEIESRAQDPGRENCITSCRFDGSKDAANCMIEAETADEARRCD